MAKKRRDLLGQVERELQKHQEQYFQKKAALIESDPVRDPERLTANAVDDDSREDQGHERVKALVAEIDARLDEINQALTKLDDGRYGRCEVCDREIDQERLSLMPWALTCVDCDGTSSSK